MHGGIAVGISVVVALAYVVSIHAFKPPTINGKSRDHVEVIRHRIRRVLVLCVGLVMSVPLVVTVLEYGASLSGLGHVYSRLLLVPTSVRAEVGNCGYCLGMICALYVGPILNLVYEHGPENVARWLCRQYTSLHGFRDHVFAPVTEELIYRAVIITVMTTTDFDDTRVMVFTPILFGVAHIHHAYELIKHQHMEIKPVMMSAALQMSYTTLFAIIVNYVFMKYHTFWGCVIIHSGCNLMGFPEVVDGPVWKQVGYYVLLPMGAYWFYRLL